MSKKQKWGIAIFIVLVLIVVGIKFFAKSENNPNNARLTTVYVATGGGKEDFLADEEVQQILRKKYKLNVVFDTWSNGKTVEWPLIREAVREIKILLIGWLTEKNLQLIQKV